MDNIGDYVIYLIMLCAILGGIASIRNPDEGLGREFVAGLHSIGPIFIPVAGIMASIPYLSYFIEIAIGPLFNMVGADPAIAGTMLIASDMGGFQLAKALAKSPEGWIMALVVGFMAGATIIFSIPVGLAMLAKKDHKYMALGMMAGILSIPFGIIITTSLIGIFGIDVRPEIAASGNATQSLNISFSEILNNSMPIIILCISLAAGLRFFPNAMIYGFLWFGRLMYATITLVLVASIVEYFTSFFSILFGSWGFDPIIADSENQFRALEIAGYIGIMLCGAFPMVYLLAKILAKPMEAIGSKFGVSPAGAAGILAASANILAMFRLVSEMPPKDKVLAISFGVCAAFTFGDHLAFSANFQPTIIMPLILGKLLGGGVGICLALWLAVPKAIELSEHDKIPRAAAVNLDKPLTGD